MQQQQQSNFHLLQQLAFLFCGLSKRNFVLGLIFRCQNQIHYRIHYFLVQTMKVESVEEEGHYFHHRRHRRRRHYYFYY